MSSPTEDLRFPIGPFKKPPEINKQQMDTWIRTIDDLPAKLTDTVHGLDDNQLDTPYRQEGWTVRQVVHHLADSHLNAYTRYRLALTEEDPLIKGYREAAWAELPDAKSAPVELSLGLLHGLHARWALLLNSLDAEQFGRTFVHAERGPMRLDWVTALYAWHCDHHLAHITALKSRQSW